jgi:hypothetical protein
MSYQLTALAIESDLKPNDRLVFIALAHCANDTTSFCEKTGSWKCWPSIDRIARFTSLSESSIRRSLKSLVSLGIVQISQRPQSHHRNLSNVYTLFQPGKPANDSGICVPEEVAPAELRPVKTQENSSEQVGVRVTATPSGEGVTLVGEGVRVTPKQIKQTHNKNNLLPREEFDPRIPPNFVEPTAWRDYIKILLRRGKSLPDQLQHSAQGDFLGAFDPAMQIKIVQQSLRNGWISLHPVGNVRAFKALGKKPESSRRPLWEDLTDRSWAV